MSSKYWKMHIFQSGEYSIQSTISTHTNQSCSIIPVCTEYVKNNDGFDKISAKFKAKLVASMLATS